MSICGVYTITVQGRAYVSGDTDIHARWEDDRSKLRAGLHDNPHLQRAFNDTGTDLYALTEHCEPGELSARVQAHIKRLPNSYNAQRVAVLPQGGQPAPYPLLTPREMQTEADDALIAALERPNPPRSGLIVSPCGTGKTALSAMNAAHFRRTLFITHTDELLEQTRDTFQNVWPWEEVGIIQQRRHRIGDRLTVASINTLHRRVDRLAPDTFDLVIFDEAHLAGSDVTSDTLRHFTPQFLLGLTATPHREDGTPLTDLFGELIYAMQVPRAIDLGYLTPVEYMECITGLPDLPDGTGADYSRKALSRKFNTPHTNTVMARTTLEYTAGLRTLVYAVDIAHAQALAQALREQGATAQAVWGSDPERAEKLNAFRMGSVQYLVNVRLLVFGYDEPSVGAVVLAFQTRSPVRYIQTVGRGMRAYPGKDRVFILDFGAHYTSGLRIDPTWTHVTNRTERQHEFLTPGPSRRRLPPLDWENEQVTVTPLNLLRPPQLNTHRVRPAGPQQEMTSMQLAALRASGYTPNPDLSRHLLNALLHARPISPEQAQAITDAGFVIDARTWSFEQAEWVLRHPERAARLQEDFTLTEEPDAAAGGSA